MNRSFEELSMLLRTRKIRPSYQKVQILSYMHRVGDHPTVDQIFHELRKEIPTLSKSTVYNALRSFCDAGIARELEMGEAETRYDIVVEPHGHFRCNQCGTIYNFTVDMKQHSAAELTGFRIDERNVYFKGICDSCLSNK
ncbi:MAG: transcriptional repressor [Firmicutes bacterium HGW-Firmicutes-11]|jgi:Fe2+ or Zn2+ uptake regulation protein|nr:MAG: transcriptional repressor [Firmicutes bacterium HGW-Firmicutes-11]